MATIGNRPGVNEQARSDMARYGAGRATGVRVPVEVVSADDVGPGPRDPDDLGDPGDPDKYRRVSPAVYAANWKTVLLVDATGGVAVFIIGLVVLWWWNLYAGAFVASVGLVYALLVARRGRQWAELRRQAGL